MKSTIIAKTCTILDMLRWACSCFNSAEIFYGHGTDNFWDESLHLILTSLNLPINIPPNIYYARLTKSEQTHIIKLINYRINKHIPVPYLTNKSWFCGLEFYVDKRVFIPRSPIAELITTHFNNLLTHYPAHILDLCTGSGCIAIAMAKAYPKSHIDAVDISIQALQVTEQNVQLHNLENRITPIHSDLFTNVPKLKYDLIITNPPYVKNKDIHELPEEFHHEPTISLSAGNQELKIINQILMHATNYLNVNGTLICEVGIAKKLLIQSHPNVPFHWFDLSNGGEGIFLLQYKELSSFFNKK